MVTEEKRQRYRKNHTFPGRRMQRASGKNRVACKLFMAKLLLTGKVWDRVGLFNTLREEYPEYSEEYIYRILEEFLPLFNDLGLFKMVGRYSFRIKPALLPMLREGNDLVSK